MDARPSWFARAARARRSADLENGHLGDAAQARARDVLRVVDGTIDVRPEDRAARLIELVEREPKPMAYVLSSLIAALDRKEHPETRANHLGGAMARAVRIDPESAHEILSCLNG